MGPLVTTWGRLLQRGAACYNVGPPVTTRGRLLQCGLLQRGAACYNVGRPHIKTSGRSLEKVKVEKRYGRLYNLLNMCIIF